MTIFFVVSGHLITVGAWRRGRMDVAAFYRRRASRILPLLLAVSVIGGLALLGAPSFAGVRTGWLAFARVLTFWHNVFMQTAGYTSYCLDVYWSLSVEEVFYALFPFAFVLARYRAGQTVPVALIVAGLHAGVRLHIPPLTWLGRHIYEMYLFHVIVLAVLRDAWPRSTGGGQLAVLAAYFALSCAVAAMVAPMGDAVREWLRGYRGMSAATSGA